MSKNDNNVFNKKQKGFYLMLLLCVLVVGVTVAVVTTNKTDNAENVAEDNSIDLNEPVDKNIKQQQDVNLETNDNKQLVKKEENNLKENNLKDNNAVKPKNEIEPEKIDKTNNNVKTNNEVKTKDELKKTTKEEPKKDEKSQPTNKVAEVSNVAGEKVTENIQKDKEISFDANEKMTWPVDGEVAMAFNISQPVYDATLDQFRTNDKLCIKTKENSQVKCAATGIVEKVERTSNGNASVVVDHGNGYKTTYGQLQKDVSVKENQKVSKGEVIGKVASPGKYSVEMGNHMDFKVTKNGQPVNPQDLLK